LIEGHKLSLQRLWSSLLQMTGSPKSRRFPTKLTPSHNGPVWGKESMKRRFSNEQIVAVLQRPERGEKAKDLCREIGISSPTLYAWKQKFGGMEVADVHRMKDLEQENGQLKKLVANLMLDNEILRDMNSRKW
jgi:putative transposase